MARRTRGQLESYLRAAKAQNRRLVAEVRRLRQELAVPEVLRAPLPDFSLGWPEHWASEEGRAELRAAGL